MRQTACAKEGITHFKTGLLTGQFAHPFAHKLWQDKCVLLSARDPFQRDRGPAAYDDQYIISRFEPDFFVVQK